MLSIFPLSARIVGVDRQGNSPRNQRGSTHSRDYFRLKIQKAACAEDDPIRGKRTWKSCWRKQRCGKMLEAVAMNVGREM